VRRGLLACTLSAAAPLASCVGSTEPATELRANGATLQARGTSDNGPAYSYFELWPSADPSAKRRTTERTWPANVSGPISEVVRLLRHSTAYSFRACGGDVAGDGSFGPATCAQTRTFTTPTGDSAEGAYGDLAFGGERPTGYQLDASSGAAGQSPKGEVRSFGFDTNFNGTVTCLAVSGTRAAIGAVGRLANRSDGSDAGPATVLLTIEAPADLTRRTGNLPVQKPGSTPPNCATASFAEQRQFEIMNLTVQDAR
jgi:hypothetical protein